MTSFAEADFQATPLTGGILCEAVETSFMESIASGNTQGARRSWRTP